MEKLEMTAHQIQRIWESLRLEWLLCPLNLRSKQQIVRKKTLQAKQKNYYMNSKKLQKLKKTKQF